MKTKTRENKSVKNVRMTKNGNRDYYFHADEDFREDRDWGKTKTASVKSVTKRPDEYEV